MTDDKGRPLVLLLTAGNVNDHAVAKQCLDALPPSSCVIADKGYDSSALREWLESRGTLPAIPPRKNRKRQYPCDPIAYKTRNKVERFFCRIKDFKRIALRYDRHAHTFLSAIAIAAIVAFWINL